MANSNGRVVSERNLARHTLTPYTLTPWPRLRDRNSMADTKLKLGKDEESGQLFSDFQQYL